MSFEDHIWEGARAALTSIDPVPAASVYVVSFLVYDEEDDPRLPTLTVGYNDEARVRETTPEAWDEPEARWNYAFWHQNELALLGDSHRDPIGAALRAEWIANLGLAYSDEDDRRDSDAVDELATQITAAFVDLAVATASRAHTTGVVERTFGRPIPILVHELEYYDEIAEQCRRANPPGLTEDFERWVRSP